MVRRVWMRSGGGGVSQSALGRRQGWLKSDTQYRDCLSVWLTGVRVDSVNLEL